MSLKLRIIYNNYTAIAFSINIAWFSLQATKAQIQANKNIMTFKDKGKWDFFPEMPFVLDQTYAYAYVDPYVAHFAAFFCLNFCLHACTCVWQKPGWEIFWSLTIPPKFNQ